MTAAGPGPESPAAEDRRAQLLGVKLTALIREQCGQQPDGLVTFPPGAAARLGEDAWVLLDADARHRLGAALAWWRRSGATRLQVIAEPGDAGVLARRAQQLDGELTVWQVTGRELVPAAAEPLAEPRPAPPDHLELRELIAAGGATPMVEHGVVFGEARGLEICRVVEDDHSGGPRLDIGIGVHDREAFAMVHGALPTVEALAKVVATVSDHRRPGAPGHPFNRLARERFLRWQLEQEPVRIGAVSLTAAEPPEPRGTVGAVVPCVATGRDSSGAFVVVVCSAGVDLELVPYAADARLAAVRSAGIDETTRIRLVLAIPARDRLAMVEDLAALLRQEAGASSSSVEVVSID